VNTPSSVGRPLLWFGLWLGSLLFLGVPGQQLLGPSWGLAFTEVFVFLGGAWAAARALGVGPEGLKMPPGTGPAVLGGFLLGLVNYPIAGGLEALAQLVSPSAAEQFNGERLLLQLHGGELYGLMAGAVLLAPLGEEILFRGVWQRAFGLPAGRAIALTAVLFSAVHFDPVGFVARAELGVLFGLLAYRTGSVWPGMAAHAANNATALVLFALLRGAPDAAPEAPPPLGPLLGLVLLGVLLTFGLGRLLWRRSAPVASQGLLEPVPARTTAGDVFVWMAASMLTLALGTRLHPGPSEVMKLEGKVGLSDVRAALAPDDQPVWDRELRAASARARAGGLSLEGYERLRNQLKADPAHALARLKASAPGAETKTAPSPR
jgi:hypothetical protein